MLKYKKCCHCESYFNLSLPVLSEVEGSKGRETEAISPSDLDSNSRRDYFAELAMTYPVAFRIAQLGGVRTYTE